jgi:DNA segregation ATPase FtsK/SpoIIIE, S-DNA-T family
MCDEDEDLIQNCIQVIKNEQRASISLLQRRLRLGYSRASRIMDELASRGLVGPRDTADPNTMERKILMPLN